MTWALEPSPSLASFLADPVGHWVVAAPTAIVWCGTPELCGAQLWGHPSSSDTERVLEAFNYRHPALAQRFDAVLDVREIELVDPDSLGVLFAWLGDRKLELAERVRIQVGVVSDSLASVTLTGVLPMLGETHAFRLARDARAALCELSPHGEAIAEAVAQAVRIVRGAPDELRRLRDLLREAPVDASIEESARALAVSARTLQRVLHASGTSFRDELRDARFSAARVLLLHGDLKIVAIAARVGLSERALTQLIREKTGSTPAELRKQR